MTFLIVLFFALFSKCFCYDEYIALKCANLAQSAYCNNYTYADFIVENFGSFAIQGYEKETQTIFTAFRGSANIHNWLEDVQVQHTSPYDNQSLAVESGFYKYYYYIYTWRH